LDPQLTHKLCDKIYPVLQVRATLVDEHVLAPAGQIILQIPDNNEYPLLHAVATV